ncbi:MAG: capsule biosynthesis GfcC family protein [Halomonas subglaciescola]|nr:capsule biosynthesis GfcC family protein [Halomonas subglaciescola]
MTAAKTALKTLAMVACFIAPLAALGQADSAKLSDGWLDSLSPASAVAWSHAFALRESTASTLEDKRRRLVAELETLITSARLGKSEARAAGLAAWRQQLAESNSLPARTPGRFDLPWLGANPRQDLPLAKIAQWGSCKPPGWVEMWHLGGVTRVPWHEGMTLDGALERLARDGDGDASVDYAWLITPTGKRHRRGIAAWNAEPTPLTAGSRVMLELPSRSLAAGVLVNERLPAYLATRLPGDNCTTWSKDT